MANKMIDFNSRVQLYYQLYDILSEEIASGNYKVGDRLPTESQLIEDYGVSRITVRKAMNMLADEGLIIKKPGYGTFVEPKKMSQRLNKVVHFSNDMMQKGYNVSVKVLENELVNASNNIAHALNIPEGSKLIKIKRLRYANNIPTCIECAYLIYDDCPEVLNNDFSKKSLRNYISKNYNINWKHASQKIYAHNANEEYAKLLDINIGDAIIYIERISYDQYNKAGEFLECYYRGDNFYLSAELEA